MTSISMLELRQDAEGVIRRIGQGERLILTYRGRPVAHLEPIKEPTVSPDDPLYRLIGLSVGEGESLSNEEMDSIIYDR